MQRHRTQSLAVYSSVTVLVIEQISYRCFCISQVLSHSCCWIWCTSIIFLLVSDSWGSLYSVYLRRTLSISVLAYWYSLLLLLKIIKAISQSHNTDSSYAFFITPNFLLLKVTCITRNGLLKFHQKILKNAQFLEAFFSSRETLKQCFSLYDQSQIYKT